MLGIPRHQAGAHAADLAAPAAHFEFRAAGQRHHQLVMIVGMGVGLFIEAQKAGN
ncbi:hypothetical protein PSm6_04950 [Pseudomonas solani]|uniref:Uncharacterized protein n=1 Tax=Pseudomonas solani TaxID=2731552 RepID=A0ABN6BJ31_9PSED|nr:hypothetical protein PSm6_04950 [Pseudomonas solani]